MKIFFLLRSLNYGGAERQLVLLAKGLRDRGHDVVVATFYSEGPLEKELREARVRLRPLKKRGRWDVLGFLFRLTRELRLERPDILHGYLCEPNLVTVILKPLFPAIRCVWGIRCSMTDLSRNDWPGGLSLKLSYWLSRYADAVISNSQAARQDHVAVGYPPVKTVVIPNGIDTERFRPDPDARRNIRMEWKVKDHEKLIGIVARLDHRKDHSIFLEAAALLAKRRKDARFVCVGDGPDDYCARLQTLAKNLGLEECLLWAGTRVDMPHVYNALDIAVSSSYSEALPNVIGEAMACGVPCVVTNVGDSAWVVGDTGEVVPPKNPFALMNAIDRMLNRKMCDSLQIRQRIVDQLSVSGLVTNTEHVLNALLNGSMSSVCSPTRVTSQNSDGIMQRSPHSLHADNSPDKSAAVTKHA